MHIVTYNSDNAPKERRWLAFIVLDGEYLPVRFQGLTEAEAQDNAQAEWDKHEVERERNVAAREEGRRKAAETRERKRAAAK